MNRLITRLKMAIESLKFALQYNLNDISISERDSRLFSRLVIKDENYLPPSLWYHALLEMLYYLEEGIEYDISSFISKENQEVAMYYLENIAFIKTDEEDDPDYRICLDDTDDESDNKLYELMIRVASTIRILIDTQFIIEYSAFYRKLTDSQRVLLYMKRNARNSG